MTGSDDGIGNERGALPGGDEVRETGTLRAPWLPFDGSDGDRLHERLRRLEAERRQLVEHVLHLERVAQVGLMTSGLAHDLANQLVGVMGAAELGLMQGDPHALRDGLSSVLGHAGRMHDTLDAFLAFVRRGEDRMRVFPVAGLVDAVQGLVQPFARSESVTVLSTASTGACVLADRQLLEQVVVNVLLNAVRAAAKGGGRVALSATDASAKEKDRNAGRRVRISVRDTGSGIPDEIRAHLFEPFVTGNAHSGGHGLGLYVARQVVERYGGRIEVDTSPVGTRIDIDLPAAGADPSDGPPA